MTHEDAAPGVNSDETFLRSLGWPSPSEISAVLAALGPDSLPTFPAERQRWLLCALLQHTADTRRIDPIAWAKDERFEVYLDFLAARETLDNLPELSARLKYLPSNRAKKHARRHQLLERRSFDVCRPQPPRPEAVAVQKDDLGYVKCHTTAREWHFLSLAAAEELMTIARIEAIRLGTLKSLLSRCRARLRKAMTGAA